jgi:hypothetical protein
MRSGAAVTITLSNGAHNEQSSGSKREGYTNVEVRIGNGYFGWPVTGHRSWAEVEVRMSRRAI